MRKIVLILLSFLGVSCGVDPCDFDCSEGPVLVKIVLVDKNTGENLFRNGTFHRKNLKIKNHDEVVDFLWHDLQYQIILGPFDHQLPKDEYVFFMENRQLFTLAFRIDEQEEKCCTILSEKEITADGTVLEQNNKGIYQVKL